MQSDPHFFCNLEGKAKDSFCFLQDCVIWCIILNSFAYVKDAFKRKAWQLIAEPCEIWGSNDLNTKYSSYRR